MKGGASHDLSRGGTEAAGPPPGGLGAGSPPGTGRQPPIKINFMVFHGKCSRQKFAANECPRQMFTAKVCGKCSRQKFAANVCGKCSRQMFAANVRSKTLRQKCAAKVRSKRLWYYFFSKKRKSRKVDLKWIHITRYGLIVRQERGLKIISGSY